MKTGRTILFAAMLLMILLIAGITTAEERCYDVVVVGAGVSGLAATWELARGGVKVAVIEMSPHYGGTAMMSEGCICIIGTPEQTQAGKPDSPQIAFEDFMAFGRDDRGSCPDAEWVRYYVTESRHEIYDWLTGLGVRFEKDVVLMDGNRVPRWHQVVGKGRGLVEPIYRECKRNGNVAFFLHTKALSLIQNGHRIMGVKTKRLRDGAAIDYLAPVVILATGGFQSNMEMVRNFWPENLPFPERLLLGAGTNAVGSGHKMAKENSAQLRNMNYQWNYATGLTNPYDPSGRRGLNAFSQQSIWVNKAGRRFVSESQNTKTTFPAILRQPGSTYWSVFDSAARKTFFISGWNRRAIQREIFDNPVMSPFVKSAPTIRELALAAGLPPDALDDTVRRWNEMATVGRDADFSRIGRDQSPWSTPPRIEQPPFYAVQFFPVTRKSMGGVAIDRSCRVIDVSGRPIPGLYAVGELTGLAGINGKASLEGTFLGASLITGRVAGRSVVAELAVQKRN